jgi:Tol biopolymer transport system component
MNADGSGITPITFFPGLWDKKPTWSPDGKQIIFWSTREGSGTFNIYVMNVDGSGVTKLTNPEYPVYSGPVEPVWKP